PHCSQNRLSFWVDGCIFDTSAPPARHPPPELGTGSATPHRHPSPSVRSVRLPPEAIPGNAIASERDNCAKCQGKHRAVRVRPAASAGRRLLSKTVVIPPRFGTLSRSNIPRRVLPSPCLLGS